MLKIRIFPVSRVALKKLMFFPTLFHVLSKNVAISLRGVHTVVHMAILLRTFVRVRPSQRRTRTKVRVRVRVRRPPTVLDFLYVVRVRRTNL